MRPDEPRIALDPTVVLDEPEDSGLAVRTGARHVPAAAPLAAGDHVGRYLIERQVGVGGMGVVYAAHDPQLDRRVAIKLLHAGRADPELATRLVREAVALAKLQHPNVVAVYDAGEVDGRVFIAMQFVEGRTLAQELAARKRGWREIVALHVAAARGLAAAHEAGLVHRDVKPGNLLVDSHGEVRVTDFGLARAIDDESSDPVIARGPAIDELGVTESSSPSKLLSSPMTQVGTIVGTPAYMAPEQHVGRKTTARSDQFSLCVALWEALYGKHPFIEPRPGETPAAARLRLGEAVLRGELVAPPRGRRVPRFVRRAVERGLATSPERRWPSMDALIKALTPPVRSAWVIAGAIVIAGAGAAIALGMRGGHQPPSCRSLAAGLAGDAWSPARAQAISDRFARSTRPYAGQMATSANADLDAYASQWIDLRAGACAATRDAAEASQLLGERRVRCLDQRLTALGVLAGLFAGEDHPEFVDQATAMTRGLPTLADCADDDALLSGVAPPGPELAPTVAALDQRLAEAKARGDAGLFQDAHRLLDALVIDADAAGYVPTQIDVDQARGEFRVGIEDPGALDDFANAAALATRARLDRDVARALAGEVQAVGAAQRADAEKVLEPLAAAAAERTGDRALILDERVREGRALVRLRHWEDAIPVCKQAIADTEAAFGPDDPKVEDALDCLIEALVPLDRADEAVPVIQRALALRIKENGADHPAVADYLHGLAVMEELLGKTADERKNLERALEIRKRAFGEIHPKIVESLSDLAGLAQAEGNLDEARKQTLAALAIAEQTDGPESRLAGQMQHQLGTLAARAGDDKEAITRLDHALAIFEKVTDPKSLEVAMVLVFEGQVLANDGDIAKATAYDARAVAILEERGDLRLPIALGALAGAEMADGKYAKAAADFQRALDKIDPANTAPINRALLKLNAARALKKSGGDRAKIHALAEAARVDANAAGRDGASLLGEIDAVEK